MVPSLPAKSTRNLLTSGDSPWLQAVLTTQEVMALLRGKSISWNSSTTDVMKMGTASKWLFKLKATPLDSNTPSPAELLHSRQVKTTQPAIIKPPHKNEAVRASFQSRQDFSRYDPQAKEFGYKTPPARDWVKMWLGPKLRHSDHIWWMHHKVNTEGIGYT